MAHAKRQEVGDLADEDDVSSNQLDAFCDERIFTCSAAAVPDEVILLPAEMSLFSLAAVAVPCRFSEYISLRAVICLRGVVHHAAAAAAAAAAVAAGEVVTLIQGGGSGGGRGCIRSF